MVKNDLHIIIQESHIEYSFLFGCQKEVLIQKFLNFKLIFAAKKPYILYFDNII